jgi:hypothetical protein
MKILGAAFAWARTRPPPDTRGANRAGPHDLGGPPGTGTGCTASRQW